MKLAFPWSFKKQVAEAQAPIINKANFKNFIVKAIGFIAGQGQARGDLEPPEYNLEEIRRAADADSYIKIALAKYSYLIYKAGYELKSENDAAIEYIKMRFRIMSFATGKPMDILFQEIADDLVKYSNAFLVKSRVDKLMPGVQARGVFNDKPIGGYFRVDPASIQIKRDKNGRVVQYQQGNDNDKKTFPPSEVIHLYIDKDPNNAFGTPRLIAALEDVKMLRRIEGNIVSLIYRFAIPIYQWMIGLPQSGFQATDKEIVDAQKEIERMPLDGVIVTNEKTQIKAIGAEGQALDASKYLDYFERRVFTALSVSESQMGRGGAKQDADSMEAQAHDTAKYIQRVMSVFIEEMMINELLLEGGFNPIFNEQDIVHYIFNEISLDTKIKVENHELLKYQSNLIPFEEARSAIGKRSVIDENRLYMNMVETPAAIKQIEAKTQGSLEVAKVGAAARGTGTAGNGKTQSAKPNKDAATRNTPSNQHGITSVKIKESMDVEENVHRSVNSHKKYFSSIYKKYENLRNDITDTNADIKVLMPLAKDNIMYDVKMFIQMNSFDGIQRAVKDLDNQNTLYHLMPNVNIKLDSFIDESAETLVSILKDIEKRLPTDRNPQVVNSVFKSLEYRIRFMLEFIIPKVYWYSYVKAGAHYGIDKAYIKFKGSDDKDEHPAVIDTKAFSIDDIPAYHSFCDCEVSFKAGDEK